MSEIIVFFFLGGFIFILIFCLIYYFSRKSIKIKNKRYIPDKAQKYKCLDGHITKSKGEMIIDNHLHRLGILHIYEDTLKVNGSKIKYDWFLPEYKIYIEYWGYFGKKYFERKKEKIKIYKKGNLKLISIEEKMFENIYEELEGFLKRYIPLDKINNQIQFCPNCGNSLDDRFI
ncbi:MAG: hypothetical protein JXA99_10095 [Candidatus Lokiarchaeota archaeon]|nr:hypothetical protein [Candidatus Lokiarchaeota archaeon]